MSFYLLRTMGKSFTFTCSSTRRRKSQKTGTNQFSSSKNEKIPHDLVAKHFLTPSSCSVCHSIITIETPGLRCKNCNFSIHKKCQTKMAKDMICKIEEVTTKIIIILHKGKFCVTRTSTTSLRREIEKTHFYAPRYINYKRKIDFPRSNQSCRYFYTTCFASKSR